MPFASSFFTINTFTLGTLRTHRANVSHLIRVDAPSRHEFVFAHGLVLRAMQAKSYLVRWRQRRGNLGICLCLR